MEGEVVRFSGVGEGSEGQASQEISWIRAEKVQVIWQEHSDWKASVLLKIKHLPLQQFDDQSVIDGLFQTIALNAVTVGAESWRFTSVKLPSSSQISFLESFIFSCKISSITLSCWILGTLNRHINIQFGDLHTEAPPAKVVMLVSDTLIRAADPF